MTITASPTVALFPDQLPNLREMIARTIEGKDCRYTPKDVLTRIDKSPLTSAEVKELLDFTRQLAEWALETAGLFTVDVIHERDLKRLKFEYAPHTLGEDRVLHTPPMRSLDEGDHMRIMIVSGKIVKGVTRITVAGSLR